VSIGRRRALVQSTEQSLPRRERSRHLDRSGTSESCRGLASFSTISRRLDSLEDYWWLLLFALFGLIGCLSIVVKLCVIRAHSLRPARSRPSSRLVRVSRFHADVHRSLVVCLVAQRSVSWPSKCIGQQRTTFDCRTASEHIQWQWCR
jgi:hypothetical protein